MGMVCFSHDTLLITDDNSTTQDDKSPPPCMQLQAGVGFFLPMRTHPLACNCETGWVSFLLFFKAMNDNDNDEPCSLSSSASVCTHDNPTTHPQLKRQDFYLILLW